MIRFRSISSLVLLSTAALFVSPALADDECPTWFPDFQCEREARFEGFTPPVTMPYLFEDPFITTGANFVGIWHDFSTNGALDIGEAGVLALQLRLAITDKLAFIATKDGLVFYDSGTSSVVGSEVGFTDITAGFKYAAIELPEQNFILTPAIRFEIPIGNRDVFQGRGDGVFIPSVSAAWGWEDLHVIASLGGQVAFNTDKDSDSIFYNLHVDYALHERFVPFVAVNGMRWTRSGDGSAIVQTKGPGNLTLNEAQAALGTGGFEGADYGNFGSKGVTGKDLVTMAWGARVPITNKISLGGAYERALTGKKNSFKQRVTFSTTYEF